MSCTRRSARPRLATALVALALVVAATGAGLARPTAAQAAPAAVGSSAWTSPGYWIVDSKGEVFAEGAVTVFGSLAGVRLSAPVVGVASTPDGGGYWLVASDGGVFSFGDAGFFGSAGALHLASPVVGMAPTPDGGGYWLVASDGGVFSFGDAGFFGSAGALHLASPVVGMAATPSGLGYWLVTAAGQVLSFGDARRYGGPALDPSLGVSALASTPSGHGYWLATATGEVLPFGDAAGYGSAAGLALAGPVVGMAPTPDGRGYLLAAGDGGVFGFGDAVFAGRAPVGRVVGLAAAPPRAAPVVAAFYYPWYASMAVNGEWRHWNEGGHDPPDDIGSDYYPARGAYSSSDPSVVAAQMSEMASAGINEVIVSWWGRGSYEDEQLPLIEREAAVYGIRVAIHIEPYRGRSAASVGQDIAYLHDSYAATDFFVYRAQDFTAAQWAPVLASLRGVTVWAESFWDYFEAGKVQSFAAAAGFQGVYTYDPFDIQGPELASICGAARMDHLLCSPSVSPGFSAARATGAVAVRPRQKGATYDQMWQGAIDSDPDLISITSYNEWHEGTQIEPAVPKCLSDGFCYRSYEGAYGMTGPQASDAYLLRTQGWVARYRQRELGAPAPAPLPVPAPPAPAAPPAAAPATGAWTISTVLGGPPLVDPVAVAVDPRGDLYVADAATDSVLEQPAGSTGWVVVAGDGQAGYSGDGGPATAAELSDPRGLALDAAGDLFIADFGNDRIREVSAANHEISTVAGGGGFGFSPDGTSAVGAALEGPSGVAVGADGAVFFTETDANRVRRIDPASGMLATVGGNGTYGSAGDGGPAVQASLSGPMGLAIDSAGDLFVSEPYGNDVREISAAGVITRVAGSGARGDSGDGGAAPAASLADPVGVAVDAQGNVLVSEADGQRVREVAASTGVIYGVAGDGSVGSGGDGGPAVAADLHDPEGLAVGPAGQVYLADTANHRVVVFTPPAAGSCVARLPAGQAVAVSADPAGGYRMAASDGAVAAFGAACLGSGLGQAQGAAVVGMATTPDGNGYWLVSSDGGVRTFGDAGFFGSLAGHHLNAPVVGMATTPDGRGYWLVASDGGVFAFGDAAFLGSAGGIRLRAPVVGMAATPDGGGYWLVASDGGVFTYGNAAFLGSEGGSHLDAPIVGMAAGPDGRGYWLVAADGGIFTFGSAGFHGSGVHRAGVAVVGMATTPDGNGYWLGTADGGVLSFGSAPFAGSAA